MDDIKYAVIAFANADGENLYKNDDIVTVGGLIGISVLCNQHFVIVFSV